MEGSGGGGGVSILNILKDNLLNIITDHTLRMRLYLELWDKASGAMTGEVYMHLFMQSSSSRRRAMRVCHPRGRMRM